MSACQRPSIYRPQLHANEPHGAKSSRKEAGKQYELYGYLGGEGYAGDKRDAAIEWLRKKEIDDERRAAKTYHYLKWTLDAAIAAAVLALIGVLWTTGVIPHWMQLVVR